MEEEFVKWKTYILGALVLDQTIYTNISEKVIMDNLDKVVQNTYDLIVHIAEKMKKDGVEAEGLNISITVSMQECQMIGFNQVIKIEDLIKQKVRKIIEENVTDLVNTVKKIQTWG